MNIIYFFRSPDMGEVSIEKEFGAIIPIVSKDNSTKSFCMPEYRVTPKKILKNLIFTNKTIQRESSNIYHITGDTHYISMVLPKEKTILTIQDIVMVNNNKGFKRWFFKKFWFELPMKHCKYITAISQKTYDDLVGMFPWCSKKLQIIECPLIGDFHPANKAFNKKYPRILQVGTRQNKNLLRVISALKDIHCKLSIIGKLSEEQINALSENGIDYDNKYNISEEDLHEEYETADIVMFASVFEGFGLPIIEAQASAKPVVTSNIPPMNNVSGGAASLVDPYSIDSIQFGIKRIIEDDMFREDIIKGGLKNVIRFSPETIAHQYETLYQRVVQS